MINRRFVLFAQGLRPLFLLAGIDSMFNIAIWLIVYLRPDLWPQAALPAMYWHGHEMIFGFIAAAIGGFLLTAVPGWTGRSRYAGLPLIVLSGIWLAGRVAMFPFARIPPVAAAVIDLAFFPVLALTLAPPLIRARQIRNLLFLGLLATLFLANLVFHLGVIGTLDLGEHIGLGVAADIICILIVIVGGRIIPASRKGGWRDWERRSIRRRPGSSTQRLRVSWPFCWATWPHRCRDPVVSSLSSPRPYRDYGSRGGRVIARCANR